MKWPRPASLQRPAGDRVKTDAKDAIHLARLLRLDEVTSVVIPTVEQEAARDLVRAREDCRSDMMRARHRLSKLLLRHGIVYYGGTAWTGRHDVWLRHQRFENPTTQVTFESDYDAVLVTTARRDRLDTQIEMMAADSEFTPVVRRLWCLRGISTLTAFALAVELGDWHRFTGSTIGSFVGLVPSEYSSGSSRAQGPITKTGNGHARRSSRPPGTTAPATSPARPSAIAGTWPHQPHEPAATWETAACTPAGSPTSTARRRPPWPTPPSPANWPAGAGRWPCSRNKPPTNLRRPQSLMAARGANPRSYYEQPRSRRHARF